MSKSTAHVCFVVVVLTLSNAVSHLKHHCNGIVEVSGYARCHVNRGVFGREGPQKVLGLMVSPVGACFLGVCEHVIVFQVDEVYPVSLGSHDTLEEVPNFTRNNLSLQLQRRER